MSGQSARFCTYKKLGVPVAIALAVVLLTLMLAVHEAGHAIAMMHRGVEIKEAGIGIPIKKLKLLNKLQLRINVRWLPFPITLNPLIVGAYVEPSEKGQEQIEEMSYKDQATIYSAGVIMNVLFGAGLVCVMGAIGAITRSVDTRSLLTVVPLAVAILLVTVVFRRVLSWLMPLIGVSVLALVVFSLMQSLDNVGGPVAVIALTASLQTYTQAFVYGIVISLSLALTNALPLIPLDGGRVVQAILNTREWYTASWLYQSATYGVFILFLVFVVGKDLVHLLF